MNSKWFAIIIALLVLAGLPSTVLAQATTYTITASAGPNGNINPSGTVTVASGGSQSYTIIPNAGYKITDVQVDGSSIGVPFGYTFSNVTGNHTISASFGPSLNTEGSIDAWGDHTAGQCSVPSPNMHFVGVSAGEYHTLGLRADGSIAAFGGNGYGQCDVPSPNTGFVAVSASGSHSFGLESDGSIAAWGDGSDGSCEVPQPNTGFVAVAAGGYHGLALKSDGSVATWGGFGSAYAPSPNTGFVAIAAGENHNLALKSDGSIVAWSWGGSFDGEDAVPSPNSEFVAVAAGGNHSLGLRSDGSIVAWGCNTDGECDVPSPNTEFVAIAAGPRNSLGLKSDGSIVIWGLTESSHNTVVVPPTRGRYFAMSAGTTHIAALAAIPIYTVTATAGANGNITPSGETSLLSGDTLDVVIIPNPGYKVADVLVDGVSVGTQQGYRFSNVSENHTISASFEKKPQPEGYIIGWGDDSFGQRNVPSPNEKFIATAAGDSHTLGLKPDGSIVAFGSNESGQCNVPSPNAGFVAVAAGAYHSLGLKSDGSVVAWGLNTDNQCNIPSPNSGFVAIAAGKFHSLGLKSDGSVVAWGSNWSGQCNIPYGITKYIAIAANRNRCLGLKPDGSVVGWGEAISSTQPYVGLSSNAGFVAIAMGANHNVGLKTDGSIVVWGSNKNGQCNMPSSSARYTAVAANGDCSLGLKADGSIVAWGYNTKGQCNVFQPNSGYIGISSGLSHSVAINANPRVPGTRVIYVSQNGNDANDGLTWEKSKRTVSSGIAAANFDDQVWVAKGVYNECITVPFEVSLYGGFAGNETSLSERPAFPRGDPDISETILDGQKSGCVVTFATGSGSTVRFDGFTVQNGNSGIGGIFCKDSSPNISHNKIINNSSSGTPSSGVWGLGGGLELYSSSAVIEDNLVSNNTSTRCGSGIHVYGGKPTISRNTITKNNYGAIQAERADVVIKGNTISENTAPQHGGGVTLDWTNGLIEGNTITNNSSPQHVGGGINLAFSGVVTVKDNVVRGNSAYLGGGGVWLDGWSYDARSPLTVTLQNNIIDGNARTSSQRDYWYDGGGIGVVGRPTVQIIGNQITNNRSSSQGGGVYIQTGQWQSYNTSSMVVGNLIKGNTSPKGSAIYSSLITPGKYINNTVVGNTSTESTSVVSIVQDGVGAVAESDRVFANNIIAFNSGGVYLGDTIVSRSNDSFGNTNGINYSPASLLGTNGNISVDPFFVSKGSGDYSLGSRSKCIDAGDNSWIQSGWTDILGNTRIFNSVVDMGAYECVAVAGSVADGKLYPTGFSVDIPSAVVSASFDDCFYIQNSGSLSGIRVEKAYACIHQGSTVHVKGTASVLPNGELAIIPTDVQYVSDPDVPVVTKPVVIGNKHIGGAALGNQPAVKNGIGLNNIGLIVRVSGNITEAAWDSSWIKIKDGSGTEVKCILPFGAKLSTASGFAVVTGVCSCEKVDGEIHPIIRVRSNIDIVCN